MPTKWTATLYAVLYWSGVTMAVACFALVFAGNTLLVWRFEHAGLPLSWVAGAVAILAFMAAEFCHSAFSIQRRRTSSEAITRKPAVSLPGEATAPLSATQHG
jgi:hypothetical protein